MIACIGIAVTAHIKKESNVIIEVALLIISTLKSWRVGNINLNYSFKKSTDNRYVLKCSSDFDSFRKMGSLFMEIFKRKVKSNQ